jgi:hypothetical protein
MASIILIRALLEPILRALPFAGAVCLGPRRDRVELWAPPAFEMGIVDPMTDFAVTIPHRLPTAAHALSRIRALVTGADKEYQDRVEIHQELWSPRGCRFALTLNYRGRRKVSGSLTVYPSYVQLEGRGDFLRFLRPRIEGTIRSQTRKLLR